VAPSATLWLRADVADAAAPSRRRTLLVAGPGLEYAADEVHALAALYDDAIVLTGADAGVEPVRRRCSSALALTSPAAGVSGPTTRSSPH